MLKTASNIGLFFRKPFTMLVAASVLVFASLIPGQASADTATYIEPSFLDDASLGALSTAGDNGGYLIALGETLSLLFDTPITGSGRNPISIFTLAPETGRARGQIRIGNYNNGSPTFLNFRNFNAGRTVNVGGLLNGCQLLGGCDYIEIETTRTRRGAAGVEVDYLIVDGNVVQVTSPTPEPKTWALMIIAFAAIAGRMKAMRRNNTLRLPRPKGPSLAEGLRGHDTRPWQGTTTLRTVHQ